MEEGKCFLIWMHGTCSDERIEKALGIHHFFQKQVQGFLDQWAFLFPSSQVKFSSS
jgi:hypothetical protein